MTESVEASKESAAKPTGLRMLCFFLVAGALATGLNWLFDFIFWNSTSILERALAHGFVSGAMLLLTGWSMGIFFSRSSN
jgi:hypothetical protein